MSLKTLRFVPFSKDHLERVLEIEKESQESPWSEASFRNELDSPQSVFLVALESGKPIGYGGCWVLADEAHITTMSVSPDSRKQGVGRRLLDTILAHAVDRGAVCATLEVRVSNDPAIKLYEAMGFIGAGIRKKYYQNKEDALIMWLHKLEA
jgi:ribosomal-protein-alanine N-acetyltransferase